MDLSKRKTELENARDQCAAQLNAILGQLQLVNELLAEPPAAPVSENGAGAKVEETGHAE